MNPADNIQPGPGPGSSSAPGLDVIPQLEVTRPGESFNSMQGGSIGIEHCFTDNKAPEASTTNETTQEMVDQPMKDVPAGDGTSSGDVVEPVEMSG